MDFMTVAVGVSYSQSFVSRMRGRQSDRDPQFELIRSQIAQLTSVVTENELSKKRAWSDDAEVLKAYVSALSATKSVLKEEQEAVVKKIGKRRIVEGVQSVGMLTKSEVEEKLNEFRQRVREAEARVEQAVHNLSVAVRLEERCILEDQITIMGVSNLRG